MNADIINKITSKMNDALEGQMESEAEKHIRNIVAMQSRIVDANDSIAESRKALAELSYSPLNVASITG